MGKGGGETIPLSCFQGGERKWYALTFRFWGRGKGAPSRKPPGLSEKKEVSTDLDIFHFIPGGGRKKRKGEVNLSFFIPLSPIEKRNREEVQRELPGRLAAPDIGEGGGGNEGVFSQS